jgi:hypothetical protein
MIYPQFGRIPLLSTAIGAAAQLAKDGTITNLIALANGRQKVVVANLTASTDLVTVNNWSTISNANQVQIFPGDRVWFLSGTMPSGLALNQEYAIAELVVNSSTDVATFKLVNVSTNVVIDIPTDSTGVVMAFPGGTRVDQIVVRSAQASRAASSAMTISIFKLSVGASTPDLIDEAAMATATASATAVGASATFTPTNGYILNAGDVLYGAQSVYAGVQDRIAYSVRGSHF